jgi:hypothetical protein
LVAAISFSISRLVRCFRSSISFCLVFGCFDAPQIR